MYSDWFFNRLREGFVWVRNPMNARQIRKLSLTPADVDCFVFWTKDPIPMLDKLQFLNDYHFHFQFTLTPYGKDIEPHLPQKTHLIDAFRKLSDRIGKKRNIWRYDPIILSDRMNIEYHIQQFGHLAGRLSGYTEKCIISFLDSYRHIQSRADALRIRPPDEEEIFKFAKEIAEIASNHNMKVETCAEAVNLADWGIEHGKCIDDRLISELTGQSLKMEKDKHQRGFCGCVTSVDIGQYNTCRHLCAYCYANVSPKKVERNYLLHRSQSPWLIGEANDIKSSIERNL